MQGEDISGATFAWLAAWQELRQRFHLPSTTDEGTGARYARRMGYLLATDPQGSWVAVDRGPVVGVGQSFVREGHWVLSLLGVRPDSQSEGVGRALLDASLSYGGGTSGMILSSRDPRAIRLYATSGFSVHPAMAAVGSPRAGTGEGAEEVRVGSAKDIGTVTAVDRAVWGAARPGDISFFLKEEMTLLIDDDRGYAVTAPGRLVALGARDETSAKRVLRAALGRASDGGAIEVDWLTAAHQWAMEVVTDARLELHYQGAVMVRGKPSPPATYLPSGAFG